MPDYFRTVGRVALLLCAGMCAVAPALAQPASDPLVDGAKLCTRYLPRYERQYGIPVHLLAAIASTESGRWHDGLHIALPWPWTINADGKSYYYDTKSQAVAAARQMLADGAHSMDIGCMQVNLQHHPKAFASLEEAFEPEYNVAYASTFLRSLYDKQHSWHNAAAAYHSRTPSEGGQYVAQVYDRWNTILDRVRMSRLNMAQSIGGTVTGGGLTLAESVSAMEVSSRMPHKEPKDAHAVKVQADDTQMAVNTRRAAAPLLIRPSEQIRMPVAPVTDAVSSASAPVRAVSQDTLPPVVVHPTDVALADVQSAGALAPAAGQPAASQAASPAPAMAKQQGPHFIFSD